MTIWIVEQRWWQRDMEFPMGTDSVHVASTLEKAREFICNPQNQADYEQEADGSPWWWAIVRWDVDGQYPDIGGVGAVENFYAVNGEISSAPKNPFLGAYVRDNILPDRRVHRSRRQPHKSFMLASPETLPFRKRWMWKIQDVGNDILHGDECFGLAMRSRRALSCRTKDE